MPWRRRPQTDFSAEVEAHLAAEIEARQADGMTEAEARLAARRAFGNVTRVNERFYEAGRWMLLDHLVRDIRYAVRTLSRSPGLLLVLVLCLGLGIGVNTALFTLFDRIVLEGPTGRDPDRLVQIHPGNGNQISYLNYRDLGSIPGFEGLAISGGATLNLRRGEGTIELSGLQVSPNFFDLQGVQAALGRTFSAADGAPVGDPNIVVLDHRTWVDAFGADPQLPGRAVQINGQPFTVIGVLASDYRAGMGLYRPEAYVPIGPAVSGPLDERRPGRFALSGRLADGVSREQAAASFTAAAARLETEYPEENASFGRGSSVHPLTGWGTIQASRKRGSIAVALAAPFVLFGLLLLIACANVAGVLLARGTNRRHELATRLAIGAGRPALVRMLLAESLVLAVLGTVGGLLVAGLTLSMVGTIALPNAVAVRLPGLQLDRNLIVYALGLALGTCVICGLVPALQATSLSLSSSLRASAPASRRRHLRTFIVAGQVAASAMLLATALMFLKSLLYVGTVDPGFEVQRGLTARLTLEENRFPAPARGLLAQQLVERLEAVPSIVSASFTSLLPLGGDSVQHRARLEAPFESGFRVSLANVGPRYFETMGIRMIRGREFGAGDRPGAPPVVIVNQAFVKRANITGNPVGQRTTVSQDDEPWREIVGVAADSKYAFLGEEPEPQVFLPYLQTGGTLHLIARTHGDPAAAIPDVRSAILAADPASVVLVRTMEEATSLEVVMRRAATWLLGALGGLGVLLAMIGLFGVLAGDVSQRTAEIGIRMALGASRQAISAAIVRDGLRLAAFGTGAGLLAVSVAAYPLRAVLAGVKPVDPLALGAVAALLLLVAGLASWIPAHRASGIDPTTALRRE
jgi:predicted permease